MSKYYKPNVEEFHVGFEYRLCCIETGKYINCVFKDGESAEVLLDGDYGNVDVKCLDVDDIEDLGYNKTPGQKNLKGAAFGISFQGHAGNLYFRQDGSVKITQHTVVFDAVVNNKSELKNILEIVKRPKE